MGIYSALFQLHEKGQLVDVRGLKTKELTDFRYCLEPRQRFMCFDHRKLKLDYIKQEFLWYLMGDRYDCSIAKIAAMWRDLINADGSINSNYGYYIFNPETSPGYTSNFARCVSTLAKDPMSRRAVITILDNKHLSSTTKDYPCTAYINFLIREDKLIMLVRMRSQDAIYGMGNDMPFFSFLQEMMYVTLKTVYPKLEIGPYSHVSDSFHVYERHFEMLEKIIEEPHMSVDWHATCPEMTLTTLVSIQRYIDRLVMGQNEHHVWPPQDPFFNWLFTRDDPSTILTPESWKQAI